MRIRITSQYAFALPCKAKSKLDLHMRQPIDAALRRAILDSGISANELARRSGVPQPTITRFLAGADMRISKAAKIALELGLSLKK
jgi:predicted transcriptional regulator